MKKILFFIIFIVVISNAKSQTWCPSGATWYYEYGTWDPWLGGDIGYFKYEYSGDTTINFISCKKIDKYVKANYQKSFYTYSDSNKIYLYQYNTFFPVFDFSAIVGDTIIVPGNLDPWYEQWCSDSIGAIKVDSIGTTIINGETLRYIYVSPTPTSQWGYNAKVIEKIGSTSGTISSFEPTIINVFTCNVVCPSADQRKLRCYSDDNFPLYSISSVACDYAVSVNDVFFEVKINIFPNPVNSDITLEIKDISTEIYKIDILNVLGQSIYYQNSNSNKINIDVSQLRKGIYTIQVLSKNGIANKKFIKN